MNAYLKAIVGATGAALAALITGADDNSLTLSEALAGALAFVSTFGAVYFTPNRERVG